MIFYGRKIVNKISGFMREENGGGGGREIGE
jgi:hypothetical protein